jgi:hypothetical protein
VSDGRIQQRPGKLRAGRVTDLEPSTGKQGPRGRSQSQQPGWGATQQRRALVENANAPIHLYRESVG